MRGAPRWTGACALAVLLVPAGAGAQSLEEAVRGVDGDVHFSYDARPGVRSCGRGDDLSWSWNWTDRGDRRRCVQGPIQVELRLEDGRVVRLRAGIEGAGEPAGGRALGHFPPQEAADWLLDLVDRVDPRQAGRALQAAVLADGVETWPRLLAFARDRERPSSVRKDAVFWLGQEASDAALDGLTGLATDDPELEVRKAAVFALSQRDPDEAIPPLSDIALAEGDPELRSSAFFWLAQIDDPRVLEVFERVLGRP
ncbi:MAG: HEAT repeat domain-containing protein [Gemmatimonadetes bacterium]|nr:HEAT repeat domain-containing protein [Gemmatimonadota bacterium]